MRWPWVSRRAYDVVLDELKRLRDRNDRLTDVLERIARREQGMPEVPRDKRDPPEKIPHAVKEVIRLWGNPATQRMLEKRVREMRKDGKSWKEIERSVAAG